MTAAWQTQPERGAGALRLECLWLVYRLFGKTLPKLVACAVAACVFPFAREARGALADFYATLGRPAGPWRLYCHFAAFARSLVDKADALAGARRPPRLDVRRDAGWLAFAARMRRRQGAVILTSHLGTAEVFAALADGVRAHAFQDLAHDSVFTRFLLRRLDGARLALHAVSDVGVETVACLREALSRGEVALMAGDRNGAAPVRAAHRLVHPFLGRPAEWPRGVFRFAELLEAPVFAVVCVPAGWNAYAVHVAELKDVFNDYVAFLEAETRSSPGAWHHFHAFWADAQAGGRAPRTPHLRGFRSLFG